MRDNRFDEILEYLCSGIMSKKERENVKDELYDHLMTKYEINLATGMDEEAAAKSAEEALGNRFALKDNLAKVHSYFPALSGKKAMTILIAGFVLMSIHINLFEGMQQITTSIGSIIFLTGLFCFRTADKNLKIAFYLRLSENLLSALSLALDPIFGDINELNIVIGSLQILLNVISWFLLFKGLKILTKPYEEMSQKPLRYSACIFFECIPSAIGGVLAIILTRGENTKVNFTLDEAGWLIIPIFAIAIASIVLVLQLFLRINKLLYASDHEYKVEDSSNKKLLFAFGIIALNILMIVAGDLAYSYQKAEITPHSIEDFSMSDDEYNNTCNNLKSYGIPDELVTKLPKSEIANFRGTVNANDLTEFELITVDDPVKEYGYRSYNDREYRYITENYIVRIKRGDEMYARVLKRYTLTEFADSSGIGYYVDGISFLSNNYNNALTSYVPDYNYDSKDWIYNDDFLLILSEENGTLYKNEPLKIYDRSENGVNVFPFRGIAGFEYEAKDGIEIIFATSYNVLQYEAMGHVKLEKLIHRTLPVSLPQRTAKELMCFEETAHNYDTLGYEDYIVSNWYRVPLIETEEQTEEYYDETSDDYADNSPQSLEPTEIFDENGELIYN